MTAGILVDRDGVLLEEVDFLSRVEDVRLMPGVGEAVAALNRAQVPVAVCTNQHVVARGEVTPEGLEAIHARMHALLLEHRAHLDAVKVCPHHPDPGTPRPNRAFCVACDCRKPAPGLLYQARDTLGLDLGASVMVGDRSTDVLAAHRAGVVALGVLTGKQCRDRRHVIAPEVPLLRDFPSVAQFWLHLVPSWTPHLPRLRGHAVILVGGASRAGKTTAATALLLALRAAGVAASHVSMDRWILPASQRASTSTVLERTRFEHAQRDLRTLLRDGVVDAPLYDPLTREAAPRETLRLEHGGVLVVDGLLAPMLGLEGAIRVTLHGEDAVLQQRRRAFYAWKEVDAATAADALHGRGEEKETVARANRGSELNFLLAADLGLVPV